MDNVYTVYKWCEGRREEKERKCLFFSLTVEEATRNIKAHFEAAMGLAQPILSIRWTPESVSTISLKSPICSMKLTFSKGGCIWPLSKKPKSPPFECELQSELSTANCSNVASPLSISSL